MLITSLDNNKVKDWKKLSDRKYREKTKTFLIEGMHLILEAYKKGYIKELILEQDEVLPIDVDTTYVTNDIINKISSLETPVNMLAVCNMDEKEVIGDKILLIDGIQDPGNLGTIIRSAVAFNIDTIVLGDNTVDCYNPKVIRASQGMIFHINIINKNLIDIIPIIKDNNIKVYGTKVTYGNDIKEIDIKDKYALVMGNEGNGVSEEVLELCDEYLYIDMNPVCESLNVAIATSIILYELNK
jgi:RNA methyltransferase, TrmH family